MCMQKCTHYIVFVRLLPRAVKYSLLYSCIFSFPKLAVTLVFLYSKCKCQYGIRTYYYLLHIHPVNCELSYLVLSSLFYVCLLCFHLQKYNRMQVLLFPRNIADSLETMTLER